MITEENQTILQKLEAKPLRNAMLLRALRLNPDSETVSVGDSVALKEKNSGMWFFSLAKEGDFSKLFERLPSPISYTFMITDEVYYDEVCRVIPTAEGVRYCQFVIDSPRFISEDRALPEGLELVKIDRSWMDFILEYYSSREFGNAEYVGRCLDENPAYGALLNGEKVGFHLTHLNGEMGPIMVHPKARGMGLAKLMSHIILPEYLDGCGIGAAMVLPTNDNCQRMVSGTNLKLAPECVIWIYAEHAESYVNEKIIIHENKEKAQ